MSAIKDKIRQLERQQAKIDLLQSIKTKAADLADPEGHDGLAAEVSTLVTTFVDNVISRIEGGENFGETDKSGEVRLTSQELSVLKRLIPALSKVEATGTSDAPQSDGPARDLPQNLPPRPRRFNNPTEGQSELTREDVAAFAIQYRNLGGRKVKAVTDEGIPVEGPVLQLKAPFILVRNDLAEGELTPVRPENLQS